MLSKCSSQLGTGTSGAGFLQAAAWCRSAWSLALALLLVAGCGDLLRSGDDPDGETCIINDDCDPGFLCIDARCVPYQPADEDYCTANEDCDPGEVCAGGICTPEPQERCTGDEDCGPNEMCHLASGVCIQQGSGGGTICRPGDSRCIDDMTLEVCDQQGLIWQREECKLECADDVCIVCVPGDAECIGQMSRACNEAGTAWEEVNCLDEDLECIEGFCRVCLPGAQRCVDASTLTVCNEEGMAWEEETCELGCVDHMCAVCTPGEKECVGDMARECNERGTAWEEDDCAERGVKCVGDVCQVCSPGEQRCADSIMLETCAADGFSWDGEPCEHECIDGECTLCLRGTAECDGSVARVCSSDGMKWEEQDCADSDSGCSEGECIHLCTLAVLTNSYIGCEYWPVVLSNELLNSIFHNDFAVVVANPNPYVTATVQVFERGKTSPVASREVASGELEVIYLPWNPLAAHTGSPRRSRTQRGYIAYRLESNVPVTAYQFNPLRSKIGSTYSYTNDASLLLPTHVFGSPSRYIALTIPHMRLRGNDMPTFVAIVGTEDGTNVNIRTRGYTASGGGLSDMNPGDEVDVTLNRFEVLQLATRAAGGSRSGSASGDNVIEYYEADLSGTMIGADKPIAVYSGNDCRFIPYNFFACDHIEQQLFHYENWGHNYIGAVSEPPPGGQASAGDFWRVIAASDGTEVTFTNDVHGDVTLNAGDWVEFQTNRHFRVSTQGAAHPIKVSQFLIGQNAHSGSMGDPAMVLAAPLEQYLTDFHFTAPTTIARNYINAIRRTGTEVLLNGSLLSDSVCQSVPGSDYEVCRQEISGGTHTVTSEKPIGLTVYGFDSYVSYGYLAGLDLESLFDSDDSWEAW